MNPTPRPFTPSVLLGAAYPASAPTETFRAHMAHLGRAGELYVARAIALRRRMRIASVLAVAALVVLALPVMGPRLAEGYRLHTIAAAHANARTVHSITWSIGRDGKRTKVAETWRQGDRLRSLGPDGRELVCSGDTAREYLPASNLTRSGERPTARDLGWLIDWRARLGLRSEIRTAGLTQVDGRPALKVVVDVAPKQSRMVLYVAPETDLLFRADHEAYLRSGYRTLSTVTYQYDEPIPPGRLALDPARAEHALSIAEGQREWSQRFRRVLASVTAEGRRIAIRDLQVNARGDVFILYTDGRPLGYPLSATACVWHVSQVIGDRSTDYQPQHEQLIPAHEAGIVSLDAYTYDGEPLHGAWFTRREGMPAPPAKHYTVWFSRSDTDVAPAAEGERTQAVSVNVAIGGPPCALTPAYMPYMAVPVSDAEVELAHAQDRANAIEASGHADARAEAAYRRVLRLAAAAHGGDEHNLDTQGAWFGLYSMLSKMGRNAEARAALLKARDAEAVAPMWGYDQIGEALKEEGLK